MSLCGYRCLISLILLSGCISFVNMEIYSSINSIVRAFLRERGLLDKVYNITKEVSLENEPIGVQEFMKFVAETRALHNQLQRPRQVLTYLKHPLNIYHFVRRCARDWVQKLQLVYSAEDERLRDVMYQFITTNIFIEDKLWPRREDLVGVSHGLIRLQETYLLDFKELATGTLNGTATDPLTLEELYDIAMVALEKMEPNKAILWLNETAKIIKENPTTDSKSTMLFDLYKKMADIYHDFGDFDSAVHAARELLNLDPDSITTKKLSSYLAQKARSQTSSKMTDSSVSYADPEYQALCRGDVKKDPSETNQLHCYYKRSSIPYRPAKVELVNLHPEMYLFHDVIYPNEILTIKKHAWPNLKRSAVVTETKGGIDITDLRVSRNAWLQASDPVLVNVFRRIGEVTGLKAELREGEDAYNEDMQVVNYGIGGFYVPHHDYLNDLNGPEADIEDRYATWLFYLDDVDIGGATVFPEVGARVPVVKGGAAFWWNMLRDGTRDERTLHAGCPVNIGSKWIANVWFRYVPQWSHVPCTLNQNE